MLITALNLQAPTDGQANSIVYIPEGIHTITPSVDGEPKEITISLTPENGEEIAAKFQKALQERLAENVRPTFDFDHKDVGPASALPKSFSYKNGKGLMAEVEWTGSGQKAIESKDYSYFSPTFLIDDEGNPVGLPDRGPLGALVNEPAFRNIPRIAASAKPKPIEPKKMSKLIFAALQVDAAHADAEGNAVKAISTLQKENETVKASLKEAETVRDELKTKVEAAEKKILEAKELDAENIVKAAIADGRIAPKDEDAKAFWSESLLSNKEATLKALDALPKKEIEGEVIKAGQEKPKKEEEPTGLLAVEAALAKESKSES